MEGHKSRGGRGRTAQVTAEHEVDDEEAVLVVLEGVAQVHDVCVVDLGGSEWECGELHVQENGPPREACAPG